MPETQPKVSKMALRERLRVGELCSGIETTKIRQWHQAYAPGVEPVVTARRIVSLDPKAQKAGGLCVALNGTPVSPADEVDAAKEYQLVSYGE